MWKQSITSIAVPNSDGTTKILTTPSKIQDAIINQNIKHFSTPETSPLGLGEFLHQAIGDHGTSDFSNRVLQGAITPQDEKQIALKETTEMLKKMQIPPQQKEHPDYWIKETIDYLLEPDLDHPNTRKYFVPEGKKQTRTNRPPINYHPSQISTNIDPIDFINCFKKWKETTASSPSGRHIGHYKALTSEPNIIAFFVKCYECHYSMVSPQIDGKTYHK